MMSVITCRSIVAGLAGACALAAQEPTLKNSIGMELVLIHPGSMQVAVFQPECPDPNAPAAAARGGLAGRGVSGVSGGSGAGPGAAQAAAFSGRGGRGRAPADPRTAWTAADYARCAELAKQDATPGFLVTIKKPYYIGKYEVTQGEWKKVMGSNPSVFQGSKVTDDADRHPVDSVTWNDAQAFVRKLNAMEKTKSYRLPTEFEWEYAGRAGEPWQSSWNEIREVAVEQICNQGPSATTRAVGTKKPNAWGLYDMLGNVWEWVDDYYNEKMLPDPVPPKHGTEQVLKGGGFASDVKNVIYATPGAGPGDGWDVGFRVARDVRAK